MRYLDRLQPLALLVLRVVLGIVMIGHGYGKVFGGFSHVHDMVQHIGFPAWMAYLLAATEFFGGILIIAGLFTRCVAVAMLIDMSVAIWKIHWHNGLKGPRRSMSSRWRWLRSRSRSYFSARAPSHLIASARAAVEAGQNQSPLSPNSILEVKP